MCENLCSLVTLMYLLYLIHTLPFVLAGAVIWQMFFLGEQQPTLEKMLHLFMLS